MLKHTACLSLLLVLLAACAGGAGIFASGTWQSGGLVHQHIHVLTVDPNNAQNIYAGDTQDGVYTSADGGVHWQHRSTGLPSPTAVYALAFDDPGKKLYAATGSGVYTSTNAAQSWTPVAKLPADTYTSIAFDLKTVTTVFVGTQHHGVLYSSDRGTTWTPVNTGLPGSVTINNLTFDSNTHELWAATSQGVYLSSNNGTSWQLLSRGLPSGANVYNVLPASVYGGSANLVYVGTNQGFYLSQDQGAHWTTGESALLRVAIYAIILDIQDPSTVYIATDKVGVLRSTDNGQNWGSVAAGIPRAEPVYALAQGATNFSQLFAAANDVFVYPGNSSTFDPSRLLPLGLALIFFYLLYRLATRGRKKSREMLKPERIIEPAEPQHEEPQQKPTDTPSNGEGPSP